MLRQHDNFLKTYERIITNDTSDARNEADIAEIADIRDQIKKLTEKLGEKLTKVTEPQLTLRELCKTETKYSDILTKTSGKLNYDDYVDRGVKFDMIYAAGGLCVEEDNYTLLKNVIDHCHEKVGMVWKMLYVATKMQKKDMMLSLICNNYAPVGYIGAYLGIMLDIHGKNASRNKFNKDTDSWLYLMLLDRFPTQHTRIISHMIKNTDLYYNEPHYKELSLDILYEISSYATSDKNREVMKWAIHMIDEKEDEKTK